MYANAKIQRVLCCSRHAEKLQPLVLQNLKQHRSKNQKIGIMIITTVMYMIFVNSFSQQLSSLFFAQIQNYIGGDMAIYQIPYFSEYNFDNSTRLNMEVGQLDKAGLTKAMDDELQNGEGLLVDYEFMEHSLQTLMNN